MRSARNRNGTDTGRNESQEQRLFPNSGGRYFSRKRSTTSNSLYFNGWNSPEKSITHQGKRGDVTEKHFITTLRAYLPKRYAVDSAIVIDSTGRTSDQMDFVSYDQQYTPTLLDQHDHKYVPLNSPLSKSSVRPLR